MGNNIIIKTSQMNSALSNETQREILELINTILSLMSCYLDTKNLEVADSIHLNLQHLATHPLTQSTALSTTHKNLQIHWTKLSSNDSI